MSFEDVGNILRTEREKKNYSIEDVAEHLKINPRYIRALENGDFESLPHLAYVKGFIRSYANFLGIPQDEIQAEMGITENESYKKQPETIAATSSHGKAILFCIVLALLIGCGWFLWNVGYFSSFLSNNTESSLTIPEPENKGQTETPVAKEQPLEPETNKTQPDEPQTKNSGKIESNAKPDEKPVTEPLPQDAEIAQKTAEKEVVKETPQAENPVAEDRTAMPGQPAIVSSAPVTSLMPKHQLIITATEECWVHSNADKTDTRQFSLRKGDTFALTFNVTLELKLGNAGGVKLRYDGQDLPPAGTSGQVKTITFPPVGE